MIMWGYESSWTFVSWKDIQVNGFAFKMGVLEQNSIINRQVNDWLTRFKGQLSTLNVAVPQDSALPE